MIYRTDIVRCGRGVTVGLGGHPGVTTLGTLVRSNEITRRQPETAISVLLQNLTQASK